jgi:amidase
VWTAAELDSLGAAIGSPIGPEGCESGTWAVAEMGRAVTGTQYNAALEGLASARRGMATWWDAAGIDVLVTPTTPELPWLLGGFHDADNPLAGLMRSASIVPFMAPFNVSGQPAISLPLGWSASGLPIGVQIVARHGAEDVLIRLASQLEVAMPWADSHPPIFG